MSIVIRPAAIDDSEALTKISFASKRYWNYPEEYLELWKDELTITTLYILNNILHVAEKDGQVIGYFSLVEVKSEFWSGKVLVNKGFWLDHLFILPQYIGQGIGSKLFKVLIDQCMAMQIDKVNIFVDPNAKGFYDKMMAQYLGEVPSSIEGRTVALYQLQIS